MLCAANLLDHPSSPLLLIESGKEAKQSESAKQLAEAEEQAKARFEKAMTELREGAYRFSSRARTQSELIIEELIDPEGDTVASLAEIEGDTGALALAQSLCARIRDERDDDRDVDAGHGAKLPLVGKHGGDACTSTKRAGIVVIG